MIALGLLSALLLTTYELPPPHTTSLAVSVGGSLNLSSPTYDAGNVSLGARYRLTQRWRLGLDLELNPFLNPLSGFSAGTTNLYASGSYAWLQAYGMEVRTTFELGVSRLNFAPLGGDRGNVGPFVGLSIFSLLIQPAEHWAIEIRPDTVLDVPHANFAGAPFLVVEYRLTVGFEWEVP